MDFQRGAEEPPVAHGEVDVVDGQHDEHEPHDLQVVLVRALLADERPDGVEDPDQSLTLQSAVVYTIYEEDHAIRKWPLPGGTPSEGLPASGNGSLDPSSGGWRFDRAGDQRFRLAAPLLSFDPDCG